MIEVNLLPDDRRKKQERFKKIDLSGIDLKNIPIVKVAAAAFTVLVIIQALLFLIGIYSKSHLASLEKRYNQVLPEKKVADALKFQIDNITKKVKAIDELMVNRFSWARKLNALSDSMTQGVWLTEIHYDEKIVDRTITPANTSKSKEPVKPVTEKVAVKYLIMSGYALNTNGEGTALIGKFIKTLKTNNDFYSDFSDIQLGSIKRDKMEDQEVMSFKITCLFK
ncbi:MAG: hypothetical protein WC779_05535 [Candidatus Omnitrophota bacterium]|jgi:hypothetical protein